MTRTGLGTFCTNCGFSFFNSPSSFLHVHVHLAFVQQLYHPGKYPRIFGNLRRLHYTARCESAWFAGQYRFGHILHQLRVFFSQLPIPFASCYCAPCSSATSAPSRKVPSNLLKFALITPYAAVQNAWFADPYRFGHALYQLRDFFFQFPIVFASCSYAPCISAHLHHAGKYPRNFANFR